MESVMKCRVKAVLNCACDKIVCCYAILFIQFRSKYVNLFIATYYDSISLSIINQTRAERQRRNQHIQQKITQCTAQNIPSTHAYTKYRATREIWMLLTYNWEISSEDKMLSPLFVLLFGNIYLIPIVMFAFVLVDHAYIE